LPDVRATLRGRVFASYSLSSRWSASASVSQDLLGRDGGALAALDLGYRAPLTERTEWRVGAGMNFGDRRYMQTYFGVSPQASQQSGLPAFDAQAGLRDLHAGIGLMTALHTRWIAFGGVSISSLQSDAAASPLTRSNTTGSFSVGIAYRCCP
jgi:MipA family protein